MYHFLGTGLPTPDGPRLSPKPARLATWDGAYLRGRGDGSVGGSEGPNLDVYSSTAPMASESEGSRPPSLRGSAEHGVVVSVSSFSKILGAGLRVGWIEAAPAIVDELRRHPYILSGGGVTPFMEQMMCEVIESGDQRRYIQRLLPVYAEGLAAVCAALEAHREECGWEMTTPCEGGFFVWVKLPDGIEASRVVAAAEEQQDGVSAMVGERCAPTAAAGAQLKDREPPRYRCHLSCILLKMPAISLSAGVRLCFAFLPPAEVTEGVHRLARAVVRERRRSPAL